MEQNLLLKSGAKSTVKKWSKIHFLEKWSKIYCKKVEQILLLKSGAKIIKKSIFNIYIYDSSQTKL
jgi:hypothetical protein